MIVELLPSELLTLLQEIEELGFSLCLVGGAPRDFFYSQSLGVDLDFEVRPLMPLPTSGFVWEDYYKKIHHYLDQKTIKYEILPYLITRFKYAGIELEFSSPRIEKQKEGNLTHHHFEASLDPVLNYEESFKRRDLTINAIGIELNFKNTTIEKVIDPYNGTVHIKEGLLKNVGQDFFSDPVRFLRLVRFQIKYETFKIDANLVIHLHRFNLSALTSYHLGEELFKENPGKFLTIFSSFILDKKIIISKSLGEWLHRHYATDLFDYEDILAFIYLEDQIAAAKFSSFFSLPEKKLKDLNSFVQSYQKALLINNDKRSEILDLPLENALKDSCFFDLKNLEDKKNWKKIIKWMPKKSKLLIEWNDWDHIAVDESELQKINPPLRSYYKFYKALKEKKIHD